MKKSLLSTAVLLLSFLAYSQEAEDLGNEGAGVTVVARAEFSSADKESHYLGNSSLYVVADGNISSNLSYSAELHLLSSTPKDLYTNTLRSDNANWLDWAYLNYDFGALDLSLGKLPLTLANREQAAYDFDIFWEMSSVVWNALQTYQWGATLNFNPSDTFYLSAQMATSQYGEKPFASGRYTYSLAYGSTFREHFQDHYSFNFIQREDGTFLKLFNVGLDFNYGRFKFYVDGTIDFFSNRLPNSKLIHATYDFSDKFNLSARLGLDNLDSDFVWSTNLWHGGLIANWMPLESLRIHAMAGYSSSTESPTFNVGLTWKLSL